MDIWDIWEIATDEFLIFDMIVEDPDAPESFQKLAKIGAELVSTASTSTIIEVPSGKLALMLPYVPFRTMLTEGEFNLDSSHTSEEGDVVVLDVSPGRYAISSESVDFESGEQAIYCRTRIRRLDNAR